MYDLAGHPVTLGYMSWAGVVADKDSILVKALRDAGAVFYVKTTMPPTGMALETWRFVFSTSFLHIADRFITRLVYFAPSLLTSEVTHPNCV
jgi:hypothetical protein